MDTSARSEPSAVGQQYEAAHAVHYEVRDLHEALVLYRGIVAAHPGSAEAGYCEWQIRNIVHAVVPKQELFEAEVALAEAHFEREDQARPPAAR